MKKRNLKPVFAAALAATMMLTACGGGSTATTAATTAADTTASETTTAEATKAADEVKITKDDIIVAYNSDIVSMDPQNQSDVASGLIIRHIYNRLMSISDDGELGMDLVEEYQMVDDTTYHFKIKEGVKFHDGSDLTTSDVKFTLDRAKTMSSTISSASHIEDVIIDNDYEFTLKLTAPYPAILYVLGNMNFSIVSEEAVTAAGDSYGENPIGSGPYKFVEWVPLDHWTVERNEDYIDGPAIASKITCKIIPEAGNRCIALETGEADIALRLSEIDLPNVENNDDLIAYAEIGASIEFMGLNCENEYFDDVRVRQAVNYAVNKQEIIDTILEGRGEIANTYVGKTIPSYNPDQEAYPFDVEKAKELMKEAGYENGFDVTLTVNGDVRTRTATLVQAQLAEIGINVDIETIEWGTYLDQLKTGELDMYILGWSNSIIDPDRSFCTLFPSDQCGYNGNNYTFFKNDEVDKLIAEAAVNTDHEARMKQYQDLQALLMEQAPWVPLFYQQQPAGTNAKLVGFEYDKNANFYFGNCHYEE